MLALNNECETGFSSIVKISKAEHCKPAATLYAARPIGNQAIIDGFKLGANWIDKTLPQLRRSPPANLWLPAKMTITRSKQIVAELHSTITASWHIVSRTKKLLSRSSKIHRTGLQGEDRP
jgi:hypothetical protein